MSDYYPLFIDLKDQWVLVVGGGAVANRKVKTLLAHHALVRIVSPQLIPSLEILVDDKCCFWSQKEYAVTDLQGVVLVFSCTEKEDLNAQVALDAKVALRLVNVVDDPEKCSFIVPSLMERGDLSIAVSTGGASPIVARQIRMQLEELYGDSMAEYLALLKTWRPEIKRKLTKVNRQVFWKKVTDGIILDMIKANHLKEAKGVVEQCFQSLLD
ncbi:MAG: precorrin-2 dehydrogenase/sirohydrochlorin ferrochelatase family protein [Desulfitobacteriaceae bacterium]